MEAINMVQVIKVPDSGRITCDWGTKLGIIRFI